MEWFWYSVLTAALWITFLANCYLSQISKTPKKPQPTTVSKPSKQVIGLSTKAKYNKLRWTEIIGFYGLPSTDTGFLTKGNYGRTIIKLIDEDEENGSEG